jgi:hypothetical protein
VDRRVFITSALTGMSFGAAPPSAAEADADSKSPKPRNRAGATEIIAEARRIVTPNGVERLEVVKIGGIDQWVSVRGKVFYSRAGRSRRDRAHPDPRTHEPGNTCLRS